MFMAGAFIPYQFNQKKVERGFFSRLALGSCLAASLFVCSCATSYKPLDHRYGYSEQQVGDDVYEVSFLANGHSSYERVVDFAMLRAAEIALSHQAKSFILVDLANLSSVRTYQTPTQFYWAAYPYFSPGGQTLPFALEFIGQPQRSYLMMAPSEKRTYYRPGVKLKVKLLPDPPGSYYPYDPAKESERLKRKYGIKPGTPYRPATSS
jgi:hypothetical protein